MTPLKAFPVNAKLEPCPIVPLARRDAVAAGVAPPLQVETTPGRRDGQRDGQETVLVGETPHREERLSLAMQSPSGPNPLRGPCVSTPPFPPIFHVGLAVLRRRATRC